MSWKIRKFSTTSFRCSSFTSLYLPFFLQKKNYKLSITGSLIPRELEGDTNIATAGFFVSSPNQNGSNEKIISFLIVSAVQLFDHYL